MKRILLLLLAVVMLIPSYTAQAHSVPSQIRVGLVERFSGRSSITLNNAAIQYGHASLQSANGFTIRPYSSNQIAIYDGSQRLRVLGSYTQIRDAHGGMISLEGVQYRGAVEFARLGGQSVTAVNVLSLEEYLFSVVPSEMPASWHPEALKAQAVAARTYAVHIMGRGSTHTGFDLCDLVCCQRYRGTEWEHEATTQAVLATAGLVAYFNGAPIEAVYFASSGGVTENSENVWTAAVSYLRSVPDPHEFEPVIWTRTFTLTEITNLLAQNNRSIGTATGMAIGGTHPSGRVESLIIHGTAGQVVLTREEIRTFFARSTDGSLQSRNFTLGDGGGGSSGHTVSLDTVVVSDGRQSFDMPARGMYGVSANGNPVIMGVVNATDGRTTVTHGGASAQHQPVSTSGDTIVITGRGFGHGVGMSQRGAEGMARRGYNFREILTHFYTGITIK